VAGGQLPSAAADLSRVETRLKEPDLAEVPGAPCLVSLEGLELAQSSLEDFVCSYFPLHGLTPEQPREVFRYLPSLAFVEGYMYDLDQANEDHLMPSGGAAAQPSAPSSCRLSRAAPPPGDDPFGPLRGLLRERGWLTSRMEEELASGGRFWALERRLCGACLDGSSLARADIEEALRLKSFDYRVMNLLLYSMRCAPPDEEHLKFLAASEVLVEVGDDLTDYAEDVERNSFNVYRCFLALYGADRGPEEMRSFIGSAEAVYAQALARLDTATAQAWQRRCQEAKRHGLGSERGPGGGDWELPEPIDEVALRQRLRKQGALAR